MMRRYECIRLSDWQEDAELTKWDIWRKLRQNTTVHGIPNLTRARGPVKKVFWGLAFCATTLAFFFNVSAIIVLYADFPVSVTISLLHENELVFPAVTVCNMSPVRRSSVENSAAYRELFKTVKERRRRKRSTSDNGYSCHNGWHIFNEHCYYVSTQEAEFDSSLSACKAMGANLTSILSQTEQDFIVSISTRLSDSDFWIGFTEESGWGWTDGEMVVYYNWYSDSYTEPDGTGPCVRLKDDAWRDFTCTSNLKYICKMQATPMTLETETTPQEARSTFTTREVKTTQLPATAADRWHRGTKEVETSTTYDGTLPKLTQAHTITRTTTQTDSMAAATTPSDDALARPTRLDASVGTTMRVVAISYGTGVPDTALPETSRSDTALAETTTRQGMAVAVTTPGNAPPVTTSMDYAKSDIVTDKLMQADTVPQDALEAGEITPAGIASTSLPTTQWQSTDGAGEESCCCTCCVQPKHSRSHEACSTCVDRNIEDATTCAMDKNQDAASAFVQDSSYTVRDEPEPQPEEGSKFAERVQTRESYQEEEKLTETLADFNVTEKANLGFKGEDLILDCQYAGADCYLKDFTTFYNSAYGNCYIFNSGWNSSTILKKSHKAGRRHGLHLIINIDQDDYMKEVGDTAGLRVVVHPQGRMPFPEEEGITVATGYATSVGLRQVVIHRRPHPYGNCKDSTKLDYATTVYEELYPVQYSTRSCIKTCYQKTLIQRCGCADPAIPFRHRAAFGSLEGIRACNSSNVEQGDCTYEVATLYNQSKLSCECPSSCHDVSFQPRLSSGVWPSNVWEMDLLQRLSSKIGDMLNDPSNPQRYKENLVKLEVYYEELNYKEITETPGYPPQNFLSDVGGVLGLWLGMSVLSLFEYVEFFIDMTVLALISRLGRNRVTSLRGTPPDACQAPAAEGEGKSFGSKSVAGSFKSTVMSDTASGPVKDCSAEARSVSPAVFRAAGDKQSGSHVDGILDYTADDAETMSPRQLGRARGELSPKQHTRPSAARQRSPSIDHFGRGQTHSPVTSAQRATANALPSDVSTTGDGCLPAKNAC